MFINYCFINVGASVGNRYVVCDVFSYVDVIFVVNPPVNVHGYCVDGDVGDFVFVSGGDGCCDVYVYIRRSLIGLFDVVWADRHGMILGFMEDGVCRRIGGMYLRPGQSVEDVELALGQYTDCDILAGDMNARHRRWGSVADVCGYNSYGIVVNRVLADMDFMVPSVPTHDGVSVIDLCAFRWTPRKYRLSHMSALPHAAQIVRVAADHDPLPPPGPNYRKARWDLIQSDLESMDPASPDVWRNVRSIVDGIPRRSIGCDRCPWWSDDLERMRSDTGRLRRFSVMDRNRPPAYVLARKVYRAAIVQAWYDHLGHLLSNAKDPDIFRYVNWVEVSRILPAMDDGSGCFKGGHDEISDLLAEQLHPVAPMPWTADDSDIWDSVGNNLDEAISCSPSNTATSYDDMSYPFVRFWQRKARDSLVSCVRHAIRYGNEDWDQGDVVLMRKADKPRYDVVKGWRMIHLLPVLAKVSERMVLLEVAKHVELESTQFGSRRGRGTHDVCGAIYEFLRAHEGYATALLSMDVEGGFDKIDLDLLADLLSARACPPALVGWIRHWASQRKIQFKFNGRVI